MKRYLLPGTQALTNAGPSQQVEACTRAAEVAMLRSLLTFHAQVLTAMGKPEEAQPKADQASKL